MVIEGGYYELERRRSIRGDGEVPTELRIGEREKLQELWGFLFFPDDNRSLVTTLHTSLIPS